VYPLALLWKCDLPGNPYHRNPRILEWIIGAVTSTLERQHSSGAFDGFCPNEKDPGVTLGVMHGLSEAFRVLREAVSPSFEARFLEAQRKACEYALGWQESHAFISNHRALFAVAFLDAFELVGDERFRAWAVQIVEHIMAEQSPEGWYREYEGPDPGYESLGIFHLAVYWRRTGSSSVIASLRRSIDFYSHCVHPDGSVGGVYGSRHTSLYFPGGFELLAGEIPMAAAVARFMRERLGWHNVVTPSLADAENLSPLAYTYLEACLVPDRFEGSPLPPLPCEALDGVLHFEHSGITVAGTRRYYAVVNAAKGGVCRVFDKQRRSVAYEDAGYVVVSGGRRWTSQIIGLGGRIEVANRRVVSCECVMAEVRQDVPTPLRFLLFRAVNLTLFHSAWIRQWLRKLIVRRLITAKRRGPIRVKRTVTFGSEDIHFSDCVELTAELRVDQVALPRCFTAIHMGSAKYFHPSELEPTAAPPVGEMAEELNRSRRGHCEFRLRFPGGAGSHLVAGTSVDQGASACAEVTVRS